MNFAMTWDSIANFRNLSADSIGKSLRKSRNQLKTPARLKSSMKAKYRRDVQVGESNLFEDSFKEPRFNGWTIGEIHVLDRRVVPNARRDNFEVNPYPILVPGSNVLDVIASRSTNDQWDAAFGEDAILAAGVFKDSAGKGNYLMLSHNASVLNGGTTAQGSLYFMARKINGGNYPNEVVPMMKTMIRGIAAAEQVVA